MTEQTQREIIKSFAYDMTAQEVAAAYRISVEEAGVFAGEHSNEITERKRQLSREGWQ